MKRALLAIALAAVATQAAAEIVFYEKEDFQGRAFTASKEVRNFDRIGFNDRASSVVVKGERWEACEDAGFQGRCVVLRPGTYPSLQAMGMGDRVSSVRMVSRNVQVENDRYAPDPAPYYDARRRPNERLYDARVISVRAVVEDSGQRCWVEHEQRPNQGANVPGAVVGGLIGGILGHQVGSGRGNDAATVVGALGGAAIGANAGEEHSWGPNTYSRDVQRCEQNPESARTRYWDVSYEFRGQEHRVQMTSPPGQTVRVNEAGEPRG